MSFHPRRSFTRRMTVTAAATALLASTAIPAQAQEQTPPPKDFLAVISSMIPEEVQSGIMLSLGVPVIGSSMFSSYVLNIPQCGLHDTRAC